MLPQLDGTNRSLGHQLFQEDVQLGFLLGVQVGRLCPDGHCVGWFRFFLVLRVPNSPNVHLYSNKPILTRK